MSPWPRPLPAAADRLIVCFSDIEMGAGGRVDDFPHSDFLGELILGYNAPPLAELAVDLVLNGDTFDLLKTSYLDAHPHQITADVALGKLARIVAAHPRFFEAVRAFVAHPGADRQVYFVTGNHDFELLFPEVQALLRSLCGGGERLHFPGFELDLGRVHFEHGSQHDALFRMDPAEPFVEANGKKLLNLPFASVGLLDVVMGWQPLLCFHERVVPRAELMELIPELKQLYADTFWHYWTRDFWQGFFGDRDPMKRLTWTMIKEVASRLVSKDADVAIDADLKKRMIESDAFDLYLMGHLHQPTWWSHGARKTLITGCLRNEYMVLDQGRTLRPLPKVFAEVFVAGGRPVRSHLVEVDGPPAPEGYVPASLFDVVEEVRRRLVSAEESEAEREAQQEQEAKEARDAKRAGKAAP